MVRDLLEVTISGNPDPLVRKHLAEVVQLIRWYCRLAELEIAAGGEVQGGRRAVARRHGRARQKVGGGRGREGKTGGAFMGRLQAVDEDPGAALEEMGG
jgi:hypothetical protein